MIEIPILTKMLNKIGRKYEELSPTAKAKYDSFEKALKGSEPVTLEEFKKFMEDTSEAMINELISKELEPGSEKDRFLRAALHLNRLYLDYIDKPDTGKKQILHYLNSIYPTLKSADEFLKNPTKL